MDKIAQQKAMKILLALTGLQLMLNFEKKYLSSLECKKKSKWRHQKKKWQFGWYVPKSRGPSLNNP